MEWMTTHKREIILGISLFLVATTAFGLGYLIGRDTSRAPIIIEKATSN